MSRREKRHETKKGGHKFGKFIAVLFVLAALGVGGYFGWEYFLKDKFTSEEEDTTPVVQIKKEEKKVQIYQGTDRPIAVMIDNHRGALPQAGLNDAYLVYEIIVEGGESRLMAVYKGVDVENIGPVRSSRHYFLDYALENDAIYVHFGWSPQAEYDIKYLGVNNINGLVERESTATMWRTKDKSAPHNVLTNTANLKQMAEDKGYRMTSDKKSVLKYVTDEVELKDGIAANTVTIPYQGSNVVKYEYNPETKRYQRYSKGIEEKECYTDEAVTTKNIIITFCKNWALSDSENKDRQTIDNITTLDGYYITNGKAIKITCTKDSRESQTVYKDLEGNEIKVNDGNTYIQICPINSNVTIEGLPEETESTTTAE